LQKIKDVLPTNGVEGLENVEFKKEGQSLCFVESSGKVLDIEEVVMYASFLYEGTLSIGDKLVHKRRKTEGEHLCNGLGDGMD
jgi:hypothetical protein